MRLLVLCLVGLTACAGGSDGGDGRGSPAADGGILNGGGGSSGGDAGPSDAGPGSSGSSDAGPSDAGPGGGDPEAGLGTFLRVGMYDLHFADGANGAQHLVFTEGAAERALYGTCTARCAEPASWTMVTLASVSSLGVGAVGVEGIGLDATGRLHVLLSGVPPLGSSANRSVYATCASDCTQAARWSLLDLSSVAQGDPIGTEETFMVAPSGALAFLTQGQRSSFLSRYVSCSSGCGSLSSWSAAGVLDGNPLFAKRDGAGVVHILFDQGQTAAGDDLHFYGRCAASCGQSASWQLSPLGFIYKGGGYTAGFTVTPSGKVYLAFNQGNASTATEDNRKLFVNACQSGSCLDLGTWSSFSLGALGDGSDGSTLTAVGEELLLANTAGFELHLRACESGCGSAAGWSAPTPIDSSAAMNAALPPDTGSSCAGTSQSASWWPNLPAIGVATSGLVVAHVPYAIVKCPTSSSPGRMPPIGRVFSTY